MPSLKKIIPVLAVLAIIAAATMALYYHPDPKPATHMETEYKTVTLRMGNTAVIAEVADTEPLRALGLSNRAGLEEGRGMWFVFNTDGLWSFWMKDTLIPLDMLWADAEGTIVTIAHEVTPDSYPQGFAPSKPARYVLEVPGGWAQRHGVAEGDIIEF